MPKIEISELEPYLSCGYDLIPLHKYNRIDKRTGKERGKSPRDRDWRNAKYDNKSVLRYGKKGSNVGVRLQPEDLIIDVDPRNFPKKDDVLKRFARDLRLDLDKYPFVLTGSGGYHYYMKKPSNILVRDSLEDYPGIEFKSSGRQVVAAGSIHPNGGSYSWGDFSVPLNAVERAPKHLLKLIKRSKPAPSVGGGDHSPEVVATMLEGLPVSDFQSHEDWLKIMMACHHASGGEARQEFIDWSTSDPEYESDAWIIGRRWDSLHLDGALGSVTCRTLYKELSDRGEQERIPRASAKDDFKDLDDDTMPWDEDDQDVEKLSPMEEMNERFWVVNENGKFRIYDQSFDPTSPLKRKFWRRYNWYDFDKLFGDRRVQSGDRTMPITEAWQRWPGKRKVDGIIFDPEQEHEGFLNLWTGWALEPRRGDWSYMQELIFEVLCNGDDDFYNYTLDWAANMFQRPGSPAEVALCFKGGKGTGKSTFGRALAMACGQHGLMVHSPEHLTGRFNSHLRDVICLFADEAVLPYDKAANSRLKAIITEPLLCIEGKGQDAVMQKNLVHIVMASNEDWVVPMSLSDERRFFVMEVNDKRRGDRVFFNKLYKQLNGGGMAAMLWDLLQRDIESWHPRDSIPVTDAAVDQKLRSMNPMEQWWFNILAAGELPFEHRGEWSIFPVEALKGDFRMNFQEFCDGLGVRAGNNGRASDIIFGIDLGKVIAPGETDVIKLKVPEDRFDINGHRDGRAWGYRIPPLSRCRQIMEERLGTELYWGTARRKKKKA